MAEDRARCGTLDVPVLRRNLLRALMVTHRQCIVNRLSHNDQRDLSAELEAFTVGDLVKYGRGWW
jgi:hypothetical protein